MKHSLKRKQERPEAFLGAIISAAAALAGAGISAYSSYRSRKEQEAALAHQASAEEANSLTNQYNTGAQNQDIVNRQMLGTAAKGGRYALKRDLYSSPVERTPIITSKRGSFVPVGDGLNYIVGPKHEQGGINVDFLSKGGKKKLGVNVEGDEAEFKKGGAMYILSAQPYLGVNGMSPSHLAVNGIVPKEVAYNIQEQNKNALKMGKSNSKNALLAPTMPYARFGYPSLGNVSRLCLMQLGGKKSTNIQDRKTYEDGGFAFKKLDLTEDELKKILSRRKKITESDETKAPIVDENEYENEVESNMFVAENPSFLDNLTTDAIMGKINEQTDKLKYALFPNDFKAPLLANSAGAVAVGINDKNNTINAAINAAKAGFLTKDQIDEMVYNEELKNIENSSKSSRAIRNDGSSWKHIYGSANSKNKFGLRAAKEAPKYSQARSIATPWLGNAVADVNYWRTHKGSSAIGASKYEHPIYYGINPADSSLIISENINDFPDSVKRMTKSYYIAGNDFATDKYGNQIYDLQPGNVRDQPVMRNAKGELSGHLTPYIRKNMPDGVDNPFNAIIVGADSKGKQHYKVIYGQTLNEFKTNASKFMKAFKNQNQDFKFIQFDSGMNRHAYDQDNVWKYPALLQYDRFGGKHSLRTIAKTGGKISLSRPKAQDGFYYDSAAEDFFDYDLGYDENTRTVFDKNNPNNKINIDTLYGVNPNVAEVVAMRLGLIPGAPINDSTNVGNNTNVIEIQPNNRKYPGIIPGTAYYGSRAINPASRVVQTLGSFTDNIDRVTARQQVYNQYGRNPITGNFGRKTFGIPFDNSVTITEPQTQEPVVETPAATQTAFASVQQTPVVNRSSRTSTVPQRAELISAPALTVPGNSIQDRLAAQAQNNQEFNPSLKTNPYWRPAFSTQNALTRAGANLSQGLETTANTSLPDVSLTGGVPYATRGGINYNLTRANGSSFGNFGTPAVSTSTPAATTPLPVETPKPSWIDRNADWAGPAVGAIGSIGAALMNYYSARHAAVPRKPVLFGPARMISQYNIHPQLAELDREYGIGQNNVLRNTASSAAARAQLTNLGINRVMEANKLWGTKTNEETKLYNENIKELNQYGNRNVDRLNRYYESLTAAQNQQRAAQAAALASIPEALANGFNQYLANRNTATLNDNDLYNILHGYEDNLDAKIPSTLTADQINRYNEQARKKGTKKLVPGKNGWEFTSARCGGKVSLKHNRF